MAIYFSVLLFPSFLIMVLLAFVAAEDSLEFVQLEGTNARTLERIARYDRGPGKLVVPLGTKCQFGPEIEINERDDGIKYITTLKKTTIVDALVHTYEMYAFCLDEDVPTDFTKEVELLCHQCESQEQLVKARETAAKKEKDHFFATLIGGGISGIIVIMTLITCFIEVRRDLKNKRLCKEAETEMNREEQTKE